MTPMHKDMHKDWTPELAVKTEKILGEAERRKSSWVKTVDSTLYWLLLFLAIVANFIVSVVLVPFLLILKGASLYFSLFFIGASFGWVFSFILHGIEKLKNDQHIIASIFLPCLALINVGIFAVLSNKLIILLNLATPPHNPVFVGAVYVLGYVLPGAIVHLRKK